MFDLSGKTALITGASGATGASTVIVKAASEALEVPLLALIMMFESVPTCATVGVPDSSPVAVLKVAQLGMWAIENVRALEAGSVAVGRKLYV